MLSDLLFRIEWWFGGKVATIIERSYDDNSPMFAVFIPAFWWLLAVFLARGLWVAAGTEPLTVLVLSVLLAVTVGYVWILAVASTIAAATYLKYRYGTPIDEWVDSEVL